MSGIKRKVGMYLGKIAQAFVKSELQMPLDTSSASKVRRWTSSSALQSLTTIIEIEYLIPKIGYKFINGQVSSTTVVYNYSQVYWTRSRLS